MRHFNFILPVLLCLSVHGAPAYIKESTKTAELRGSKVEKTDRKICLPNATLRYLTQSPIGKKKVIKEKWGDYFFGLEFGRKRGTNGGWSLWNFMQTWIKVDGKVESPAFLPDNIFVSDKSGKVMASFQWPASGGSKAKLTLDILSLPSCKDWLFFKIAVSGDASLSKISLHCYPGNSDRPKERERIAVTKNNLFNLSKKQTNFIPKSPGLILGSSYRQEDCACLVVFENEKIKELLIPRCSTGVGPRFLMKPDVKEFMFALGYFIDKPRDAEYAWFKNETQDIIFNIVKKLNWNLEINKDSFRKEFDNIKIILSHAKKMNLKVNDNFNTELYSLKREYEKNVKLGNSEQCRKSIDELLRFKQKLISQYLSQLK